MPRFEVAARLALVLSASVLVVLRLWGLHSEPAVALVAPQFVNQLVVLLVATAVAAAAVAVGWQRAQLVLVVEVLGEENHQLVVAAVVAAGEGVAAVEVAVEVVVEEIDQPPGDQPEDNQHTHRGPVDNHIEPEHFEDSKGA